MLKSENKMSELQDLLDSDDELPTSYNEVAAPPAYLNDRRFDAIQFSWLANSGQTRPCPKKKEPLPEPINLTPENEEGSSSTQSSPEIYQEDVLQSTLEAQETSKHKIQYSRKTYDKDQNNCGPLQTNTRTLIKMGILSEKDILCMKSLAALSTDDATLLWFIDFLIYKDLQSDFKFLRSCLVDQQLYHKSPSNPNNLIQKNSSDYLELVIV